MSQDLLRHTVASLAYRAAKALRGAPPEFATYSPATAGPTPVRILAHMSDLFDWALSILNGQQVWRNAEPLPWDQEVERFFASLQAFDARLATGEPLHVSAEQLFQGPIADAISHVGQLAMLRRMAGCSIGGENYFVAEVAIGRVGLEQAAPKRVF